MKHRSLSPEEETPMEYDDRYPLICYANRELSWLKFNARVLEEACAPENPLGEQLSFAAIFQSNLDEFFMVRVGTIYDQLGSGIRDNKTGMSAREQLDAILADVKALLKQKDAVYASLEKRLSEEGFTLCSFDGLTDKEKRALERMFLSDILPLLSPQIVAPKQPFPFLQNEQIYAVLSLRTKNGNSRLGIVPCTGGVLRRLVPVPGGANRYLLMEDLILHFAALEFAHYRVASKTLVRIVRNADISVDDMFSDLDDHKADYRATMEKMIRMRRKLSPIKLEYRGRIDSEVLSDLCRYLDLPKKQVFRSNAPLDLSFLYQVQDALRDRKELFFPRRTPQRSPSVDGTKPIIPQIEAEDKLLAYPFESMRPFLQLLEEAGRDPDVTSIRMTLYRVAHNSLVVGALARAAEQGKEVLVLVELRARFDEENNLDCSQVLEDAGCKIIYGLDGIKTHSKLCLITRQTPHGIEYITQVGTGNYSEKTAKLYTDLCLMTANSEIGMEAGEIFRCLSLGTVIEETQHLLVAPHCLQNRLVELMDGQIARAKAGEAGYIGVKCNSLTDKVLIDKLIEASQAGVRVEMIVRGIACLVSGLTGYTENIHIQSIVGRYLEHSRIYIFGSEGTETVYISSADFMTRNTTRRVEVAAPIYDPKLKARLLHMFRIMWDDNVKARVQGCDGVYTRRVSDQPPLNAQEYFFEEAYRAAGTPLPTAEAAQEQSEAPAEPEAPVTAGTAAEPAPEQTEAPVSVEPAAEPEAPVAAETAAEPEAPATTETTEAPTVEPPTEPAAASHMPAKTAAPAQREKKPAAKKKPGLVRSFLRYLFG